MRTYFITYSCFEIVGIMLLIFASLTVYSHTSYLGLDNRICSYSIATLGVLTLVYKNLIQELREVS